MRKEVLIVEADRRTADLLVLRLTGRGYGVASAASQAEAEQAVAGRRPDLVILGLGLPGGERLVRQVRLAPGGATVPVLLLGTGSEAVSTTAEAVAAGADDFFRKPAELDLVVEKVAVLLGPARPGREGEPITVDETVDFSSVNALPWSDAPRRMAPPLSGRTEPRLPSADSADFSSLNLSVPPAKPELSAESPPRRFVVSQRSLPPRSLTPVTAEASADLASADWLPEGAHLEAPSPEPPPRPAVRPLTPPPAPPTRPPEPPRPDAFEDRPGRAFQAPEAPVPEEEAQWQAQLQPGRALPLSERPLGPVLIAAARLSLTGRIEVSAGGALRRIFLDAGRPSFFDSSDPEEDLAATLVSEGLVTRAAVARARARARSLGAAADELLIEQGFVAAEAVYRALRTHVIERVIALFALETGDALVVQGGPRPPDPVDLGLPPGRLVMDAIRRRYGRLRLYQAYGTPVVVPRLRRHPGEELRLRSDEEAVLRACDARRTAAEIARGLRLAEVDVLAVLYGLAVLGCLETPLGAGTGTLPPLPGELIARAGTPRGPEELPGYTDLVARKLADVQSADYFTILEIPRGATGAELEAAWESLRRRFDPHRLRPEGPLFAPVQEIAAVLDDARALLMDARRRALYEAALGD